MNSSTARLEEKHGGKVTYFGFVHTFNMLLPPEQYFDAHPEYFCSSIGKRLKERTQLCCMNEDAIRIVTEAVQKNMREHPEATVFSVSQNDWYNYCECDKCTALAESEGSQLAPVLAAGGHRREIGRAGIPRQTHRHARLSIHTKTTEDHARRTQRDHPPVQH